jgi:hypothetical protein
VSDDGRPSMPFGDISPYPRPQIGFPLERTTGSGHPSLRVAEHHLCPIPVLVRAANGTFGLLPQAIGDMKYRLKSPLAQRAATCNAIEYSLKLHAFLVTGYITL